MGQVAHATTRLRPSQTPSLPRPRPGICDPRWTRHLSLRMELGGEPASVRPENCRLVGRWPQASKLTYHIYDSRHARPLSDLCGTALPEAWRTWTPNQLRHLTATKLRAAYGIECAQLVLGHSKPDVTLVYAARDVAKAAAI